MAMPTDQPNLVFVFPDQMRGSAMGFRGQEPVHTPNLDAFAGEGRVLCEAVSTYPVCSPYRAMLMTGQFPHRNHVLGNCTNRTEPYGNELDENTTCWSDVLAEQGYSLGYIGKWHLDSPRPPYIDTTNNRGEVKWNEWCPPHRRHGFDFWYAYGTYDMHMRPMYWAGDADRQGYHYVYQWGPEHEADTAIRYLQNDHNQYRDPDKPFALVVSMNPPHGPYDAHPDDYFVPYADMTDEQLCTRPDIPPAGTEWGDHFRKHARDYYASITGVDEQFGRILKALDDQHLAGNTLVIFTSDHGDCIGIHEHPAKSIWWEAAYHVPFIARFPGRLQQGHDDLLINTPDIYPTMLGLLGLAEHIPPSVMGTNHAQALTGESDNRPTSQLYQWPSVPHPEAGVRGVRTHRWKLAVRGSALSDTDIGKTESLDRFDGVHLYDREADPYELNNLAREKPQIIRELVENELKPWLKRSEDPFQVPEILA